MDRTHRAMFALVCTAGCLFLLVFLLGAAPAATSPIIADAATQAGVATPSDVPAPPTATPKLPTPTPTLITRILTTNELPKIAPTSFLPGRGPTLPGELTYTGRRLDVYVGQGTFTADEVAALALKAEQALSYMQQRFAVALTQRVSVGVYAASQAPGDGTRGIAYTHGDTNVRIYYRPGEDQQRALVVLAHELAHALQAQAYGKSAQGQADTVLLEGLASWITGEYWLSLSGTTSFQDRAATLYHAGYTGNLAALGTQRDLNNAYDLWAGFVDYLTRTYGWDKFNRLYQTGRGRAHGSANYVGVYGQSFQELADAYYATLK